MRRWFCLAVTSAALGASANTMAENEATGISLFTAQARVQVDAQGQVVAVQADAGLPAAVATAIQDKVSQWRFAPPMQEGKAVAGVTFVRVVACAAPEDDHYRLALAYRGNGPSRSGPRAPLFTGFNLLRQGQRVEAQLDYRVMADGTAVIEKAEVTKGGNAHVSTAVRDSLKAWIRDSKFEPEQLDGHPVATRMSLPISFEGGGTRSFGSMASAKRYYERDAQALARNDSTCQAALNPGTHDDGNREVAVDSPFHLLPAG